MSEITIPLMDDARAEYLWARSLIRENGAYALRWMPPSIRCYMERLHDERNSADPLAERASIVRYARREGVKVTPLHTASDDLLRRFYERLGRPGWGTYEFMRHKRA